MHWSGRGSLRPTAEFHSDNEVDEQEAGYQDGGNHRPGQGRHRGDAGAVFKEPEWRSRRGEQPNDDGDQKIEGAEAVPEGEP